ncbi:MAG: hypothetical protein V4662_12415 [Verrucomicrobiota bacterium]
MQNSQVVELVRKVLEETASELGAKALESIASLDVNDAAHLIDSMMNDASALNMDQVTRVSHIMGRLEVLADSMPGLALSLMNALKPIAGELCMHDVYDSIELWEDAETKARSAVPVE